MNMLPGNKYLFETYDFRSQSKADDDFLFVVRHNPPMSGAPYVRIVVPPA